MWIYGTKLVANYVPTSLTTYGHPAHNTINLRNVLKARYGQLRNRDMAYIRKMPDIKVLRTAPSNACQIQMGASPASTAQASANKTNLEKTRCEFQLCHFHTEEIRPTSNCAGLAILKIGADTA